MLTASEARALSGKTPQEYVEDALKIIESEARLGKRVVALHDDFWVNGGYAKTNNYKEAVKILEELGYKVEFFYEQRQFVNMYTKVSW